MEWTTGHWWVNLSQQGALAWSGQVVVVVGLAVAASWLIRYLAARLAQQLSAHNTPYFRAFLEAFRLPASLAVWLMTAGWILRVTQGMVNLPLLEVIPLLQRLVFILLFAWFLLRFISLSYHYLRLSDFRKSSFDSSTAEVIYKLLQLVVVIAIALMFLQSAGISISGLLAFGGVGGLAVGLAARDMLANLFGGLTLYLDRPFRVGEKIRILGTEVEGWVEDIGWRKTRVRNYERQPIYVPNALFGNSAVVNPSRVVNRRIRQTVGLRYEDRSVLPDIMERLTTYLKKHQEIDKNRPIEVRFVAYGASSLDVLIYCFAVCKDYEDLLRIQEQVLLKAGEIIMAFGADIAFPTRRLEVDWPAEKNSVGSTGKDTNE
ncbi:Low conductance mechanosensitive channel YnaI [invertebrate metagenome]|uniref:Low conductance mechanosensitive channel YnaI n=1 Tax=invertebrate metagenome TaxID=1711999 RepID=A0A2H9T5B5_9ZZZZ